MTSPQTRPPFGVALHPLRPAAPPAPPTPPPAQAGPSRARVLAVWALALAAALAFTLAACGETDEDCDAEDLAHHEAECGYYDDHSVFVLYPWIVPGVGGHPPAGSHPRPPAGVRPNPPKPAQPKQGTQPKPAQPKPVAPPRAPAPVVRR